jgi:nucleoside-diphosphate-sugar epimerase
VTSQNTETLQPQPFIVEPGDRVLVTGASGFIGAALVDRLLDRGCQRVRAFVRPTSNLTRLEEAVRRHGAESRVEIVRGDLLSPGDCRRAAEGVSLVYHLAAGTGDKSYPSAFMGSVVTTRNLLDACLGNPLLRRFVNISSFAVYSNMKNPRGRTLDEASEVATHPELRGDAYSFAKVKQDEIVAEYSEKYGIPYVIVRPGSVYGPGKTRIPGRVGIDTFGFFMHMGGPNTIPFTYIDNCADLIVLAGLRPGIEGEVFNAVDDDLPSSRRFLRLYKRRVRRFRSLYIPHWISYLFCWAWESYSYRSEGQLPLAFTTRRWHAEWKRTRYSNRKARNLLGWSPLISTSEGLDRFFENCREDLAGA